MATTWDEALAVKRLDSHAYEVNLQRDWCIGTVPNGGYVASCFMRIIATHFRETLKRDQPHTMIMHMEFPRRAEVGLAKFVVKDVKLGRQQSTVHVSLIQHDLEEVLCYITQTNLNMQEGPSLRTGWELQPKPYDVDLSKLRTGQDPNWIETSFPASELLTVLQHVRLFVPRKGQFRAGVVDQWMCFREGGSISRFTNETLGFVADILPSLVDSLDSGYTNIWCATVVLNLDIKKVMPSEGLEWLFLRAMIRQLKNGKMDIDVVITDETGELVALSNQVTLVFDMSRNTAQRERALERGKIQHKVIPESEQPYNLPPKNPAHGKYSSSPRVRINPFLSRMPSRPAVNTHRGSWRLLLPSTTASGVIVFK